MRLRSVVVVVIVDDVVVVVIVVVVVVVVVGQHDEVVGLGVDYHYHHYRHQMVDLMVVLIVDSSVGWSVD